MVRTLQYQILALIKFMLIQPVLKKHFELIDIIFAKIDFREKHNISRFLAQSIDNCMQYYDLFSIRKRSVNGNACR